MIYSNSSPLHFPPILEKLNYNSHLPNPCRTKPTQRLPSLFSSSSPSPLSRPKELPSGLSPPSPKLQAKNPSLSQKKKTKKRRTQRTRSDTHEEVNNNVIYLFREVEMFQWIEKLASEVNKKVGVKGNDQTSHAQSTNYEYEKTWTSKWIDSSGFQENRMTPGENEQKYDENARFAIEHKNPRNMPLSHEFHTTKFKIGDFVFHLGTLLSFSLSSQFVLVFPTRQTLKCHPVKGLAARLWNSLTFQTSLLPPWKNPRNQLALATSNY